MIPFERLTTLFLDVGNTLISVDFDWIAREIRDRGHACEPEALRRAEAGARPELDRWLRRGRSTEAGDAFTTFLGFALRRVASLEELGDDGRRELARELAPVLRRPGRADELWRMVMPDVPEALARLGSLGLELVAVSNADGTVERGLETAGLRGHFAHVIDSAVVGFEKPDARIFEIALRRASADPQRTLHVGDLPAADVRGARAAGLHAALLDPYGDWADPGCPVFRDLAHLADTLASAR
jgi:HAD superfamily hydrolase (TIGR01509 family)